MRAGVKLDGKRRWRAEMTWDVHICGSGMGGGSWIIEVTDLCSAPHILFEFAPNYSFWYCPCDFFDIPF
jgi:hypothetical protein